MTSPELKSVNSHVAVYGSLKKGLHNHQFHLGTSTFKGNSRIEGFDMYSMGSFPMIVQGEGSIDVEVYEITDDEFDLLDRLEGYPHFYDRMKVNVTTDQGTFICWIYLGDDFQVEDLEKVDSGNWQPKYVFA